MVLSIRFLSDVGGVNNFQFATDLQIGAASPGFVYFQLIDASVNTAIKGWNPPGRRYMPAAGATLTVTFNNLDDSKVVTRVASQPFSQDPSIWRVQVLATDFPNTATVEMGISLNEAGAVSIGCVCDGLRIVGGC